MNKKSGQAVVFVLLVMLLGLTVALSVTSRTLSDLKQTTVTDQSSRAFSLAEAGIEAGLADMIVGTKTIGSLPEVKYTISQGSTSTYTTDGAIAENEVAQLNFLTGYTSANVTVDWTVTGENPGCSLSENSGSVPAALEISVYSVSGTTYDVKKYAFDGNGCDIAVNSFPAAGAGSSGYLSSTSVNIPTSSKAILRVRPIYNRASIRVTGANLPADSYTITSYATVSGQTTRALQVTKTGSALPPIFDYVLYSGQDL